MSLQTLVNKAQQIEFDRGRIISTTISRSQRIKTAERDATQPWRWTVTPPGSLNWSSNRGVIELIDYNDRDTEYTIQLGQSSGQAYLVKYQGELDSSQRNSITISTFTNQTLVLGNLPAVSGSITTSTVILKTGDFVQPNNSRYPYTVISDVLRGSGSVVTATVHRNLITSEGINPAGQTVKFGVDVSWRFMVLQKPTYSAVPYDRLQFNGDFVLIERII